MFSSISFRRRAARTCCVASVFLTALVALLLTAGVQDPPARQWREGKRQFAHTSRCTALAFAPDGQTLATVGGDDTGEVKLWDVATFEEIASLEGHADRVMAVAFSPDGKTLATGNGRWNGPGEVILWELAPRARKATLQVPDAGVLSLAFSPDGHTLAAGSGYFDDRRYAGGVTYWSVATGENWGNPLQGYLGEVPSLAFSADGRTLVTSSGYFDAQSDKNIWELKLWEWPTGKERSVLYSTRGETIDASISRLWPVAFSRDGKMITAGGMNADGGLARLWNVATGGWTDLPGHKGMVWSVAFSPDGKTLATGDGTAGLVRLWELPQGKEQAPLNAFTGAVFSLAFSPDGRHLVAGGTDGAAGIVQFWMRSDGDRFEK